jgi:hypothetical protein
MSIVSRAGRIALMGSMVMGLGVIGVGCLSRPVAKQEPTTKVNFGTTVRQQAVDKIDLLLAIDNSGSMADKQQILAEAVPDLVGRLLRPRCVDPDGNPIKDGNKILQADPTKNTPSEQCSGQGEPEFKPISDIHIAIVTSSLGGLGGDVCPDVTDRNHNDRAQLVTRVPQGADRSAISPSADGGGFLAWFPDVTANSTKAKPPVAIGVEKDLNDAFKAIVRGTGQVGCGLEAQLESMYQFLVQPDPFKEVAVSGGRASLQGYNEVILQQRKDFLRADSLVAVVMLTDEDDSSADPLTLGGTGFAFMSNVFPQSPNGRPENRPPDALSSTAAKPTSACADNPNSPKCSSCAFYKDCAGKTDETCLAVLSSCSDQEPERYYGATEDPMNVRFYRMKQRFGIDPQYPVSRYVEGLRAAKVPNRENEHGANGNYIGTGTCVNPLFAKNLPGSTADALKAAKAAGSKNSEGKAISKDEDLIKAGLCNLERGLRSSDLVYFAVVGGAPNELLFDLKDRDNPSPLATIDFIKLTGKDPQKYDFSGIDPHMYQSVDPRDGLEPPPADGLAAAKSCTTTKCGGDPAHGREWDTLDPQAKQKNDLQYACTFPLDAPLAAPRVCKDLNCDCTGKVFPPLCGGPDGRTQMRAKAYPTIRQFSVVRLLGEQGIAASLCPLTDSNGKLFPVESDFYGYRPAVAAIVDRLKNALATQCLPQALTADEKGEVPCLILETLPDPGPQSRCKDAAKGLSEPAPQVLAKFLESREIELGKQAADELKKYPVCQVQQIVTKAGETCARDEKAGWCYIKNTANSKVAGNCPQAIKFSQAGNPPVGAKTDLTCIQQFGAGVVAGDDKAAAK